MYSLRHRPRRVHPKGIILQVLVQEDRRYLGQTEPARKLSHRGGDRRFSGPQYDASVHAWPPQQRKSEDYTTWHCHVKR